MELGTHIDDKYKYSALTARIIKAAMAVHGRLGNGFQELIYQRALVLEMREEGLNFERECEIPVFYRGIEIGSRRVDFLVEGKISVELKALTKLEPVHYAQAINYLEAFNLEVGLLINFGSTSLEFKRFSNRKFRNTPSGNVPDQVK
jgi:GxxExxY protein